MISINDKRANQLLSSSLIGLTKQQGVMFHVPSWKPRGKAGIGSAKTLRCPSRREKSTLKWIEGRLHTKYAALKFVQF